MRALCFSLTILAISVSTSANAACEIIPSDVQEYLRSESGWSPVDTKDLPDDDKTLWEQYHHGLCPGIAIADLGGKGEKSYALALLSHANARTLEKLVVVRRQSGRLVTELLVPASTGASPLVVWRLGPGRYRDLEFGRTINIPHDSFGYEKIEASSTLYYFSNGKFNSILVSN